MGGWGGVYRLAHVSECVLKEGQEMLSAEPTVMLCAGNHNKGLETWHKREALGDFEL